MRPLLIPVPRRRTARAMVFAAAAAIAATAVATVAPTPVAAQTVEAPSRNSPEIAALAGDALAALDQARVERKPSLVREYTAARNRTATLAADALDVDAGQLRGAWANAGLSHQVAVLAAVSQLGVPYRRYTREEGVGFDCSGLTGYAWARAGHPIEFQSARQLNAASPRTRDTAQPGDLVEYPGHVMMYLGVGNAIIHAPYTGKTVELSTISESRASSVRWGDPTGA